jgi:hypothetical protein
MFGIGVSASYTKSYDQKTVLDYLRVFYLKNLILLFFMKTIP